MSVPVPVDARALDDHLASFGNDAAALAIHLAEGHGVADLAVDTDDPASFSALAALHFIMEMEGA